MTIGPAAWRFRLPLTVFATVTGLAAKAQTGFAMYALWAEWRCVLGNHLRPRNHAGHSFVMIRPEYLEALGDLGYSEQESRFLYLAATHSGYFSLRQFLDFTGTAKGWNVHQFTSKSIRLGHVRAATCGYRTSFFNLYSRRVYGALDRDNLRNRRRLSSELIRTRLLILDFVLAHPGLQYLETEADKTAYLLTQLGVPEALIPGRVYKGIDPNSTTKRCFVDRFPVFFSMESECPPGELTSTFVYCDFANRGLFHYITHLRHYEHFLRRLSGFYFVYAAPSSVKFHPAEQIFRSTFEENSAGNVRSIARYFRVRRLWDENKHDLLTRADRDLLRYGNQRYRDVLGVGLPEMGRRRDGGTGPGGSLGSAPDGTEVEVPHPSLAP